MKWQSTKCLVSTMVLAMIAAGPAAIHASDQAQAKFKSAGKAASLTVYPARVVGRRVPQVGETIAMLMEKRGMTNLDTSLTDFTPPDGADLAATAQAFAKFIQVNPPETDFAMFAEIKGSKDKGLNEIITIVVNRHGEVAWQDRQAKGDAEFDRIKPREPLQCCVLIVERLRPVLNLNDAKHEAPPGKIAKRWLKETGIPDKAEMERIQKRGAEFKKSAAKATLIVYPIHARDVDSPTSSANLAALLSQKKLTNAQAASAGPNLEIPGNINEQKVLWTMANALSDHVKKNPPQADYVLFADYLMNKEMVGAVHFAVCNKLGELVIVDFQNSHSPDFKAMNPKTREDCDKLVAKRLQGFAK